MKLRLLLLIILFAQGTSQYGFAQLSVNSGFGAQQYGDNLAGSNISVTNATISGDPSQFGIFEYIGNDLQVNSGVILSTGVVADAIGPNNSSSTSTSLSGSGDPDLTQLNGNTTYDAAILEFEFEVQSDEVEFNFVFMSEEYNEYVGTQFNDVFAFYISGPGIVGQQNLALVPGTLTPITINTINNTSFSQYYTDNTNGSVNVEFDGFTTLLTAYKNNLITCGVYTLSIRIADAGDYQYDAAVLLQENSLVQSNVSAVSNTYSANNTALEGCIDASFTFELSDPAASDIVIPIELGGTAINGVDYAQVDPQITIPAGQTAATIIIDAFADGLSEGQESIEIYYTPSPCAPPDTVVLYIDDYAPIEYNVQPSDVTCNGLSDGLVDFTITGGAAPYTISLTDSATGITTSYGTNPVTGLDAGTYYVEVLDGYGCSAEDLVAGNFFDAGQTFIPDGQGGEYTSDLLMSGFGAGETLQSADQIQSICATMEHSRIGELEILLTSPDGTEVVLKEQPGGAITNFGEPCAVGPVDAGNTDTLPGIGYNYCWQNIATYGTMVSESNSYTYTYTNSCDGSTQTDKYLPSGSYEPYESFNNFVGAPLNGNWTITVRDYIPNNNGYIFDWSITLQADPPDSIFTIFEPDLPVMTHTVTEPDCGMNNGAVDFSVSNAIQPVTFLWSTGATTEDISGLAAGIYTVDVTDGSGCTYTHQVDLSNNGLLATSGVVSQESCFDTNDGAVDLSVSGAVQPVSYSWSSGSTQQDIFGLVPGTYTVTVQDGSGCQAIESFTINAAPMITITGVVSNESCGEENGAIQTSVYGATQPLSYAWSNFTSAANASNLEAGNYTVQVTDANNCQASQSFNVINLVGNCLPDCDLEIAAANLTNEQCGQNNGSIQTVVTTTNGPVFAQWSNGATSNSLTGIGAGVYDVTFTDMAGCEVQSSYTISNESGTLSITGLSATDESCGEANGAINASVVGGTQPYTFSWSNGGTTEDLSNLSEGVYVLTVTDDNNCSVTDSVAIVNNTGTLTQTGYVIDAVCGVNGVIDIEVSGGQPPYNYLWNVAPQSAQDQTYLSPGTYYCVITDANGCSLTTPNYVVDNLSGSLSIDVIDVGNEVCSDGSGEILLTISGGATPYSYAWSNASTTSNLGNLSEGTYSCTVSDMNGCSVSTGSIELLNESGNLQVDQILVTDEVCGSGNGAIFLDVTSSSPPITYAWSNNSNSEDQTNLSSGSYFCNISDTSGCTLQVNAFVNGLPGTLSIDNVQVSDENCGQGDGVIDLLVSGGSSPISYLWNTGATTEDVSGVAAGMYSVEVTDAMGCSVSTSVSVGNQTSGLSIDVPVIINEQCGDASGSIDLTVNGGTAPFTFLWSTGATSEDLLNIGQGAYSCTVTDAGGCTLNTGPIQVNNGNLGLDVQLVSVVNEVCSNANGSIEVAVSNGVNPINYAWSNGGSTETISNLIADIYTLTVTDANGCTAVLQQEIINSPGTLVIDAISITDEVCGNTAGAIDLDILGGATPYTFLWSNGATTEDLSGIAAGTYSVTVMDTAGCTVSTSNMVVNNHPGDLSLDALNIVDETCGDGQGNIDISISGNVGNVSYLWSNGATTEDLSNLSAGTYTATIVDDLGCSISITAVVQNTEGALGATASITHLCPPYGDNGSIDLFVTDAIDPVSFLWSNFDTTQNITELGAGLYTVTIVDGSGCSLSETFEVENNGASPEINEVVLEDVSCLYCTDGSIAVSSTSTSGPNTYLWSTGDTTSGITELETGTYWVEITSPDGCQLVQEFTIANGNPDFVGYNCRFSVYPNPSDGLVTLSYTEWPTDELQFTLHDMHGRLIEVDQEKITSIGGEINLDLSLLASGVYFLHLYPECGTSMFRLVLQ